MTIEQDLQAAQRLAHRPLLVTLESGVPGRDSVFVRFLASGPEGAQVGVGFTAEKAIAVKGAVTLAPFDPANAGAGAVAK